MSSCDWQLSSLANTLVERMTHANAKETADALQEAMSTKDALGKVTE